MPAELYALLLEFFERNSDKAFLWYVTGNPLLGGISPKEMVDLGRYEKLLGLAKQWVSENEAPEVKS
jgi:hypothetical protein